MSYDNLSMENLTRIVKYSDSKDITFEATKNDISLVDLNSDLIVSNTYNGINVWGRGKKSVSNYESAEYQLFILRVSFDSDDTEQNLAFPFLSALRLSQQPFNTIVDGSFKNLSNKMLVVLLIDAKKYSNRERAKDLVSYYLNKFENLIIYAKYKYDDEQEDYTYELLEEDEFTFGKIFPLLPISDEKHNFPFKSLDYRELTSIRKYKEIPSYFDIAIDRLSNNVKEKLYDLIYGKNVYAGNKEFIKQYEEIIGSKLQTLTCLAQIIFLTMLKGVSEKVDENVIYPILCKKEFDANAEPDETIEEVELNQEVIMSIYLSAIEYADGISQILENSVTHSSEHIGFFSMRTYYVDCNSPPSSSENCAHYRYSITQKCNVRGNGPFENCRYMIEFTAIDYAIPIPNDADCATKDDRRNFYRKYVNGIYDVFKKNNPDANLVPDTLEGVFNFRSREIDQIAHHLGLKLFRNLIVENGGMVVAGSPRRSDQKEPIIDPICYFHNYKRKSAKPIENKTRGFTYYVVMLPIQERSMDLPDSERSKKSFAVNDSVFDDKSVVQWDIPKPDKNILDISKQTDKSIAINKMREYYTNQILSNTSDNIVIPVITYELTDNFMEDCERFAKMSLLVQEDLRNASGYPSKRRFLALNFVSNNIVLADQAIGYFIRIYASFYKKADGGIPALGCSQLALFANVKDEPTQYVMNISGESIDDLRTVAEYFVYSGFPIALKQANQLRYLFDRPDKSSNSGRKVSAKPGDAVNLFPYDLFVRDEQAQQEGVFISSINRELNRELGAEISTRQFAGPIRNGVRLKPAHVALSVGIHLDTFYQAELLFYNNSIIKNFAILIARDLINKLKNNDYGKSEQNGIVVIGYENYSHVLTEQVTYYLEKYADSLGIGYILGNNNYPHVAYCTFAGQIDIVSGIKTRVVPKFRLQHLVLDKDENLADIQMSDLFVKDDNGKVEAPLFVIVEPIATTSNTILQIRRALRHFSDNAGVASINYSLIVSAPKHDEPEGEYIHGLDILSQYWYKDIDPKIDKFGQIQLKRDYPDEVEQVVQYLIHVGSNWHNAHNCPMCDRDVALDWVDKTSTTTYLIHELLGSSRKGITYALQIGDNKQKEINSDRIGFLRGNIAYGHTQTQSNHFLFNLDLKHMLESHVKLAIGSRKNKVTCRDDVEKWLGTIGKDSAAFNILISPLHERNSPFVRMVSEFALKQNIRFIHFDVSSMPRETVRTDFIYVADEISNIINDNHHNKVNVYYCDDSNVSGESIHRAMLIMKMLLNEAHLAADDYGRINLFKGIILFVNRSSYESLQQFVRNPETDVYSYINLGVPNYNTHQGICYDCSFIKKLELEKKRTVSSRDICDIDRLIQKHRLLTVDQFWEVIKSELFTSGKYVKWLKSWRLINPKEKLPKEINAILTSLNTRTSEFFSEIPNLQGITDKNYVNSEFSKIYEQFNQVITNIDKICLNDLISDDLISEEERNKNRENIWQFFKNRVIADRYYMRLLCTHKLYCALEHVSKNAKNNDDLYKKTLEAVLDLLIDEKQKIIKDTPKEKQRSLVHFCELLISYIKILSREQLVRYYHIRQVAIDIMLYLLLACINGVNNAKVNSLASKRVTEHDTDIFDKYRQILDGLIFSNLDELDGEKTQVKTTHENSLNAGSQAFLVISLIKKIAHLDSVFFMRNKNEAISLKINEFSDIWKKAVNKYFGIINYQDYYNSIEKKELTSLTTMPSFEYFVNVYQNALRWTLLTTHDDDGKSYRVEDVYSINKEESDE
ncbi:MAG: hypothetical protein HDT28_00780 [Clostridiales bacterium]|nr:hypothetical protein [Clostridiales bacterium]